MVTVQCFNGLGGNHQQGRYLHKHRCFYVSQHKEVLALRVRDAQRCC